MAFNLSVNRREILYSVKGIRVDEATIRRALVNDSYTFKRVHLMPKRRNCPEVIARRKTYAEWFLRQAPGNLVYMDESGFMWAMRRGYGFAKKGQRAILGVKAKQSMNMSLCAAIDEMGIVHHEVREKSHKAIDVVDFLGDLVDVFSAGRMTNKVIILDNCSVHRRGDLEAKLRNTTHTFMFLPPYSPFLNPIENVFFVWKYHVRGEKCENREEVLQAINLGAHILSTNTGEERGGLLFRKYFAHVNRYIGRCMASEEIWDEGYFE